MTKKKSPPKLLYNAVANTATIASSVFDRPSQTTIVEVVSPGYKHQTASHPVTLTAFYKKLVIWVFAVAIICLLVEIALAFAWPNPTSSQQNAFGAVDFGWKAGLGLIIGLLSGKQL